MPSDSSELPAEVESLSALTLATRDMPRSVRFYQALGFKVRFGGEDASFTTLVAGTSCLNLIAPENRHPPGWWGRAIFYVSDVDKFHDHAVRMGLTPDFAPRDAEWGERYFHLTDPDGHELSFAKPL
ncbi:VOC family protein [Candidatus Laterigemmans baculatus]|uniref:VOC family protein n=1 Tax=Candidatus Laterigemmans baculatus TaxID=2770505 RepID=UPI0013D99384|nr:VOC family protein [Candidatus Laterigemmans baculatus]